MPSCSCLAAMREVSRNGWVIEVRPSIRAAWPADTDVACKCCGAVYRLRPARSTQLPAFA